MRARNSILGPIDLTLVGTYFLLVFIGWVSIFATEFTGDANIFMSLSTNHGKQMIWISASLLLFLAIIFSDKRLFNILAYPIYGIVLLMLLFVLVAGQAVAGNKSWINLGFFKLQPSEFAKFATALALARYLSEPGVRFIKSRTKYIAISIVAVPFLLVLLQEDVGSCLVFLAFVYVLNREGLPDWIIYLGLYVGIISVLALAFNKFIIIAILFLIAAMIYYSRRRTKQLLILLIVVFIASAGYIYTVDYLFNKVLQPHQQERINVLLGKETDDAGAAYNVNQSKIAIGSGGLIGKGFLQGTQTRYDFVPEMSTDFIFCSIGEEWGFIGSTILLGIYAVLLLQLIMLADRQRSSFNRVYMYSVAAIIFMHVFVNIGMTIGLLPVIGIPLPFLSYGGSSLLSFTAMLAIAIKLDSERLLSAAR
jgi:rod shape determining protein RodA